MKQLDRTNPLPLWAQLLSDLRDRLDTGEFGEKFPTDEDLTSDYGVSRQTVREAVRRLQSEGYLIRERGRGSRITNPVLEQPLRYIYSLAESAQQRGLSSTNTVLKARIAPAGERAEIMQLGASDPVVALERLRLIDGEPFSLESSWLPAEIAGKLLEADLTSGSIYEALKRICAVEVTGGWETIRPALPDIREANLLALPSDVAAFSVERLAMAQAVPVEFRISLIRGDRCSFRAEWPAPLLS